MADDGSTSQGDGGQHAEAASTTDDKDPFAGAEPCDYDAALDAIAKNLNVRPGNRFLRALRAGSDVAARAPDPVSRRIGWYLDRDFDEAEAFEDLVDWLALDEAGAAEMESAIPAVAGLATRAILHPLAGNTARRPDADDTHQLLAAAAEATRLLVAAQGADGVRVLPALSRILAQRAQRTGAKLRQLAAELPRIVERLASNPSLIRRLTRDNRKASTLPFFQGKGRWETGGLRRVVLRGPVEITILER